MVILDDGYFVPADDWLRVRRRLKSAVSGKEVPIDDRLYVSVDDVGFLPDWLVIYVDENGEFFVRRSKAREWKDFNSFKDIFR